MQLASMAIRRTQAPIRRPRRRAERRMALVRLGLIVTALYLFGYYAFHDSQNKSLVHAIEHGDVDGVRRALKWGADPDVRNVQQQPALLLALTISLDAADLDVRRTQISTALLEHGASVRMKDRDGSYSALRIAISNGYSNVARLLMSRGANLSNEEGASDLRVAAARGHNEVVALLLDSGVPSDAVRQESSGETPLMMAALRHNVPVVKTLLARGADVNRRNDFGVTALMFSVMDFAPITDPSALQPLTRQSEKMTITRLLLEHHADPLRTDRNSNTALDYARARIHAGTVMNLRGIMTAARTRHLAEVVTLLEDAVRRSGADK